MDGGDPILILEELLMTKYWSRWKMSNEESGSDFTKKRKNTQKTGIPT